MYYIIRGPDFCYQNFRCLWRVLALFKEFQVPRGFRYIRHMRVLITYLQVSNTESFLCSFNQLDLPEYPSKQHLEERLLLAIHEANEGFGFG